MRLTGVSLASAVALLAALGAVSAFEPPDWCPCPWCGGYGEDHHAAWNGPPGYYPGYHANYHVNPGPGYGPYYGGASPSGYYLLWYVLGWAIPLLVIGGVLLVLVWLARRFLGAVGRRND